MKFKLETQPPGVMICHILQPLSRSEVGQFVQGIEKVLANGKARIVIHFQPEATDGEGGADFLEKSLRPFRVLAKKMGGDIHYAVPGPAGEKILGASPTLDAALAHILGRSPVTEHEHEKLLAQWVSVNQEMEKVRIENKLLTQKVKDLLELVRKPSTDSELKDAVQHYKTLAMEAEAISLKENPPQ